MADLYKNFYLMWSDTKNMWIALHANGMPVVVEPLNGGFTNKEDFFKAVDAYWRKRQLAQ